MYVTGVGPMGSDRVAPCQAQPFSRARHQLPIAIVRIVTLVKCHARDDTPITASPSDAARWLPYLACSQNYSPHQLEYSPHQLASTSTALISLLISSSTALISLLGSHDSRWRREHVVASREHHTPLHSDRLLSTLEPPRARYEYVRTHLSPNEFTQRVHPTSAALSARSRSHA
jgi:hypothetical protein